MDAALLLANALHTGNASLASILGSLEPDAHGALPLELRIRFHRLLGRPNEALGLFDSSSRISTNPVLEEAALAAVEAAQYSRAEELLSWVRRSEDLDRPLLLTVRALLELKEDRPRAALSLSGLAIERAAEADGDLDAAQISTVYRVHQLNLHYRGAMGEASRAADRSWALAAREGTDHLLLAAAANAIPIHLATGSCARAANLVELVSAYRGSPAISASWVDGLSHAVMSRSGSSAPVEIAIQSQMDEGNGSTALRTAERIIHRSDPGANRFRVARWSIWAAFAASLMGQPERAAVHASRAQRLLADTGFDYFEAHALLARGLPARHRALLTRGTASPIHARHGKARRAGGPEAAGSGLGAP